MAMSRFSMMASDLPPLPDRRDSGGAPSSPADREAPARRHLQDGTTHVARLKARVVVPYAQTSPVRPRVAPRSTRSTSARLPTRGRRPC